VPDYEADVWRRPVIRLVKGCADATQGNELWMALREGRARHSRGDRNRNNQELHSSHGLKP